MRRSLAVAVVAAVLGAPAAAEPLDRARALYDEGAFDEAAAAAAAVGDADALALAARATNVRAVYLAGGEVRRMLLARAEHFARRALALDPEHIEASLQLVIALGYEARAVDALQAFAAGLADEAGRTLDRVSAAADGNPYYHAVAGAWHGELVGRAGTFLAGMFYGAERDQARAHFKRALTLDPQSALIATEYAKLLLALDGDARRARKLLERAVASPPKDAHRELVRREAARLLADLDRRAPPRLAR